MANPFTIEAAAPNELAAKQVLFSGNRLYITMVSEYRRSYNAVWYNPTATPDAIVAAMGTQAQNVFARSAALAAYLYSQGATDIPLTMPAGWDYQAHDDGSVTLTKQV